MEEKGKMINSGKITQVVELAATVHGGGATTVSYWDGPHRIEMTIQNGLEPPCRVNVLTRHGESMVENIPLATQATMEANDHFRQLKGVKSI